MPHTESSALAARLAHWAHTAGPRPAITGRSVPLPEPGEPDEPTIDYAKFWRRVQRVTGHLQSHWGLQAGDRLAWLGLNHELQLVTLVACARLGLIFTPLNYRLAAPELRQILQDAQAHLLVHDSAHTALAHQLQDVVAQHTVQDKLIDHPSPRNLPLPVVADSTPLLLVYTSGTTGVPKGALHTQAALLANAEASQWAHELQAQDTVLSCLPMFHVGGLCIQTLPALLVGAHVVLHARFDPGAWLQEMALTQPTLSLLVPATMRALFEHPDWHRTSVRSLRGIMTGSSTVPVAYLTLWQAHGVPVGQIYGSTETGPVSVALRLADAAERMGSVGWPHPLARIKLVDAEGQEVSPRHTGEVCIQGPNLMDGYWNAQGESGHGLQDGWFHTGDLGQRGEDGCLTIVGRSKDMIISGGENIYPAEIENLLSSLPGVEECAVVGVPDLRWGEVPLAAVVRTPDPQGRALTEETVMDLLHTRIARFKWPKKVVFLDELPKSALGKVQKNVLQTQLLSTNP